MTTPPSRTAIRWFTLLAALALPVLGGCDLAMRLTGGYAGPLPSTDDLVAETVILVGVQRHGSSALYTFDRRRFVEAGDPHNVNRVIQAWVNEEDAARFGELKLSRGASVIVTTRYSEVGEGGGSMGVDDWPGHNAMEYPVGVHSLLNITRAVR